MSAAPHLGRDDQRVEGTVDGPRGGAAGQDRGFGDDDRPHGDVFGVAVDEDESLRARSPGGLGGPSLGTRADAEEPRPLVALRPLVLVERGGVHPTSLRRILRAHQRQRPHQ